MSIKCLLLYQSDGESVSAPLSDGSSDSSSVSRGNARLRAMSVLEVRRLLKKELIGDEATMARWQAWENDWQDRERTYAAAQFRAFERGERGGRWS